MKQEIFLRDGQSGEAVPAELISGISDQTIEMWANTWQPAFDQVRNDFQLNSVPKEKWPEDAHWDWGNKLAMTKGCLSYEPYSIMANGSLEGLMLLNNTKFARLPQQRGESLIYIEFLAVAPWNRKELCNPRRYVGVGAILADLAIQISLASEFKGRIGLHSLPGALSFYRNRLKMSELGPDQSHNNLLYFEMTPEQAETFLAN